MQKTLACSALFLWSVACGGNDAPPVTPVAPDPTPAAVSSGAPVDMPAPDAGAMVAPMPAPDPALTDEQIVKVTGLVNEGEIEAGKMAKSKAKDPKVKKFAEMMIKHHGEEKKKEEALAKKLKFAPSDSPLSIQVAKDNTSTADALKSVTGADFDKAYMAAMVKGHAGALDAMDTKLLPAAQNTELKAALTAFRPAVEEHLKQAKEIEAGLK